MGKLQEYLLRKLQISVPSAIVYVGYRTRISYRTRMVHTVCVYAYGTTIRIWYGYLYHMGIYYIFTVQLYNSVWRIFAYTGTEYGMANQCQL